MWGTSSEGDYPQRNSREWTGPGAALSRKGLLERDGNEVKRTEPNGQGGGGGVRSSALGWG